MIFKEKWIVFFNLCLLNSFLGMGYYSLFPSIDEKNEKWFNQKDIFFFIVYPLIFSISAPIFYELLMKNLLFCNIAGWVLTLLSLVLKFFFSDNESYLFSWQNITSDILVILSTALILPGYGVLCMKYFYPDEHFIILSFGGLAHPIGIGLRFSLEGYIDKNVLNIVQIVIGVAVVGSVYYYKDLEDLEVDYEYLSLKESIELVCKDETSFVLFVASSLQIGLIYTMSTVFESFYQTNISEFVKDDAKSLVYTKIVGFLYVVLAIVGCFVSASLYYNKRFTLGLLARLYVMAPFVLIFFLGFVFKGLVFYLFYCVLSGLTYLPLIGYLHMSTIGSQFQDLEHRKNDLYQSLAENAMYMTQHSVERYIPKKPVSLILSYYIGIILIGGFRFLMLITKKYVGSRSWLFALIQLLVSSLFLSSYEDHKISYSIINNGKY